MLIMSATHKLDEKNFIKQVLQHGYIAEQIPTCFDATSFAYHANALLPLISIDKKGTLPTTLSTYKNDISRRVLSLPNPEAFLRVVKLMADNWNEIKSAAESQNSLSPITYIHSYHNKIFAELIKTELINNETMRDYMHSKSDYLDGTIKCIKTSLGYKYRLDLDVANFYNTIYTHSITWAMCGKKNAKKYLITQQPTSIKKKYELADQLDKYIRIQKNTETNGIVVGPFTSRIFSEMIMAELDRKLIERGFVFRRYVDDYKFYFRTESQAQESLPIIEKVLNEYCLNINPAKTEIHRYPFDIISPIQTTLEEILQQKKGLNSGVFGVLNAAAQFQLSGHKGAYKYVLKMLKGHDIPSEDFDIIMPSLINIMLIDPKYGKYVINYLKQNNKKLDKEKLSKIMNHELASSIKNELQQESLLFMQIFMELSLNLNANNLLNILKSGDDFSIIIALDIWKNKNKYVQRTRSEATKIKKAINSLVIELNGETMSGSHWLLLHEILMHKLIDANIIPVINRNSFFKELIRLNISFYMSIKNK